MSVTLKQLTEDPILLAEYIGEFTLQDMLDTYEFTAEVMDNYPDTMIYRVHDIRQAELSFPVMMQVIKESNLTMRGSNIDEHVQVIFVGRSNLTDIVRDAMVKHGKTMPTFETLEAALDGINLGLIGKDPQG